MSISKPVTRRESLLAGLFGTGYIGLRALATGLPPWFLLNPRQATAQDLQCMLNAKNNNQYLILSTSSNGDPVNCNCPGTYENTSLIHPTADEMTATPGWTASRKALIRVTSQARAASLARQTWAA